MEIEMENIMQEKEKEAQTTITTVETLPLTTLPITTPKSATTKAGNNVEKLEISMEGMNLMNEQIKRLEP